MNDQPRRMQIPLPQSSGETPNEAIQFERDWPGLTHPRERRYLRRRIDRELGTQLAANENVHIASALPRLSKIANIINLDVKVRPGKAR
jgi:hypothetical protein